MTKVFCFKHENLDCEVVQVMRKTSASAQVVGAAPWNRSKIESEKLSFMLYVNGEYYCDAIWRKSFSTPGMSQKACVNQMKEMIDV